jgi:hypothetical protein
MVVGSIDDWIPARASLCRNDELQGLRSLSSALSDRNPFSRNSGNPDRLFRIPTPAKFRRDDGLSRECPHLASAVSLHQADLFDEVQLRELGTQVAVTLRLG